MLSLLSFLGGLLYRIRGGWLCDKLGLQGKNVIPRCIFAFGTALYSMILTGQWEYIALFPLVYVGIVMGWFKSADIGRDKDRSRLIEFLIMSGRGLLLTGASGLFVCYMGSGVWFMLSGALLGTIYELAHRTPSTVPNFATGMELAEFYTGTWIWLILSLSLM